MSQSIVIVLLPIFKLHTIRMLQNLDISQSTHFCLQFSIQNGQRNKQSQQIHLQASILNINLNHFYFFPPAKYRQSQLLIIRIEEQYFYQMISMIHIFKHGFFLLIYLWSDNKVLLIFYFQVLQVKFPLLFFQVPILIFPLYFVQIHSISTIPSLSCFFQLILKFVQNYTFSANFCQLYSHMVLSFFLWVLEEWK
ncbi:unnamed protein product (macronuclear) [Paramecium tetraurelia]|uniref:Transmembrane protein n=1 Tax=Paramecium tetraurelia TaxID=5888 RepID=A0BHM4_PARTE|nr:uncharacterized protein GSPATT00029076001 [Paramecium tetraurelia]CAK58041.1 unnamed protein product [Paramecium tetraurelia]|eukprot:XP_001425439.1 hypothetical protein (macronuclear) [Paramecium tetraurelia strain d4-2]